jgi:DNA polymerase III epsilon subunit family exonuclease
MNGFCEKLQDFLDTKIIESPEVTLTQNSKQLEDITIKRRKPVEADPLNLLEVSATELVLGVLSRQPRQIKDILALEQIGEQQFCSVAGKVSGLEKRTTKAGKTMFKFRLDDTTGNISVLFFPRGEKPQIKFEQSIANDKEIWLEGIVRRDAIANAYCIFLDKIAIADIDYSSVKKEGEKKEIVYKTASETYETIYPMPYIEKEEVALAFDLLASDTAEDDLPEAFNKTYVIFDVETTGKFPASDKIVEIAAVKMVNGVFTETFSSLIDPLVKIPPDASNVHGIYDKDVVGAPIWRDAVSDFYKFTRDAVLVSHNIDFDIGFLENESQKECYNFDNDTACTLALSRKKLKNIKYNLGAVCKELGVPLTNAHRALDDAVAAAKVFKCLLLRK